MDRGDRRLLNSNALRDALRRRTDGRWSFLAAAAGDQKAIEELAAALSRKELDRGTGGAALTPSLVSERVEALAVSAGATLARVALGWRKPAECGDDPFWTAAWVPALRHLAPRLSLNPSEFRLPATAREAELLWPTGVKCTCTWNELAATYRSRYVLYDELREWSLHPLADRRIEIAQMANAPALLIRLLRGRYELLTAEGVEQLRARAEDVRTEDSFEAALLAEVLSLFDNDGTTALQLRFLDRLTGVDDPRGMVPLAYVLLGNGWLVP
jgi:hypothetical protein